MNKVRGFTFVEVVVTLSIFALAGALILSAYSDLNRSEAVGKSAFLISSVLNRARSLTLSSKDNTQYGVHIETKRVTLFKGGTYDSMSTTNIVTELNSLVSISQVSLAGGGQDVVFARLSGKTLNAGSMSVSLDSDSAIRKSIIIYETGVIETD